VTTAGRVIAALAPDATPMAVDRETLRGDLLRTLPEAPSSLADDDHLIDLGLDSIMLMALVGEWRARGADVSFEDLAEVEPTLEAWWPVVQAAQGRPAAV
jgi:aryl carrier-like protein